MPDALDFRHEQWFRRACSGKFQNGSVVATMLTTGVLHYAGNLRRDYCYSNDDGGFYFIARIGLGTLYLFWHSY